VIEETGDSVILKVEKNDTLGNRGQVTIWKTSLRPLSSLEEANVPEVARNKRKGGC
jgi:hypothetical protein